ncbi:Pimeloyl-ACP methyl ester carboxylesterase [Rhizobiales bacterium GAS191]|jgi:pimeloyl-ACP methyl ester carboxylesterase|nr:Pimeloyl-ACP methyl ester carboxylesterase [Rhizobiales bacterium GAS191]SED23972.1 Pimeloyl-ACP methyl ester carboxylesterase [Rhizobiales bacterium GAS188]
MSDPERTRLDVGEAAERRAIAVLSRPGEGSPVIWLGGFKSDMASTKAGYLDAWAERKGRPFLRFDYSGHGQSEGRFEDGTIGRWLDETLAVITSCVSRRPILVGSSMGGWIALLASLRLMSEPLANVNPQLRPAGLVLIAPAVDFTEELMWKQLPDEARRDIEEKGLWLRPSAYSPEPYAITRQLIEEGRRHLLLGGPIQIGCPVHILQGMRDPDVPWRHALTLMEHLADEQGVITLINDGDHRLSREEDLVRLVAAIEGIEAA